MTNHKFTLPKRARSILYSVSTALITVPEDLLISQPEQALTGRCSATVREFPALFRRGFVWGLYLFDMSVVFWGYGFKRFVHLDPIKQQDFLECCLQSRSSLIRNILAGIRGLVMISFFSHPDVWKYIGYDPSGHLEERRNVFAEVSARE